MGHRAFITSMVLTWLLLLPVASVRAGETVQSLPYGVALFHYFQGDYFNALTELMAAQQRGELDVHTENAELLRGGMSLSFGMDREAERIFERSLDLEGQERNRNQAWFYLARIAWQRGDLERAQRALANLTPGLERPLAQEALYLNAAIGLSQGDRAQAARFAAQLESTSPWVGYYHYNLGADMAAAGDWRSATAEFSHLETLQEPSAELRALRDKALTAAGYAYLSAGEPALARAEFVKVRLQGPLTDQALLGYGWAAGEQGDYLSALAPWQTLNERSLLSASARESLLAVPYAYEQLGRPGDALQGYQLAAQSYRRELSQLEQSISDFTTLDLWSALGLLEQDRDDWLFNADIRPSFGSSKHLVHLIGQNRFQIALREYRDLHRIQRHLTTAQQRLQTLRYTSAEQQRVWHEVAQSQSDDDLTARGEKLAQRINQLRLLLANDEADLAPGALATAQQAELWTRLQRASKSAELLGPEVAHRSRLMPLYRGLMAWDDSEAYPGRIWQLRGELVELEVMADVTKQGLQKIAKASELAKTREESKEDQRIFGLEQRVLAQFGRVDSALADAESEVRHVAVTELERQAKQLQRVAGQSQLAIARLYDRASDQVPR
ncbi:MAG: hypothetical protein V7696_12145 [Halioglobus sp.]